MKITFDDTALDWQKMNGLIPAIVQDLQSKQILMLGYMNRESLAKTLESKQVTFYSRSKQALWTKGETSGNYLTVCSICHDCDSDAILITAQAQGPTCHKGNTSCFGVSDDKNMIAYLEKTIAERKKEPNENSYTSSLFKQGITRIAQKVGEEGVEVALAAVSQSKEALCQELADLFFHMLVLTSAKDLTFQDVLAVLANRAIKN
ncbi:MAG: bifunctional phosphoribosyl-AMP cyclohydrolase/phosphoribosyl-ATP diphosphatase HisIE [Gammaproteobacteria bacterium]|jgi:phosphoribosyl-ATP pyrophosphohydrolase/phosphoribosyl-AMP cyclohydrolase|nr:bifunctional phosphoribosyl-AMP cyclohydrolase/phosphoribosyl-ATP diphosphatase HisIE [Gammaproteobacteria bacterium]